MLARRYWNDANDPAVNDLGRALTAMHRWQREMDRVFGSLDEELYDSADAPLAGITDTGTEYVFRADVPGLTERDIEVVVNARTVTVKGERKVETPEGWRAQRRERGELRFCRSYTLPVGVEAEHARATVKDGVFELVLPKLAEAQPRKIEVSSN